MQRIIKNTFLNYIPNHIEKEATINPSRIFERNNKPVKMGNIIYLCEREIRAKDNFALQFAIQKSKNLNLPLKIIHPKINYEYLPKQKFIKSQIEQAKSSFEKIGLDFEIINTPFENYIKNAEIAILITDFNPLSDKNRFDDLTCKIYEVDGHNIIPARFISDKQEYSAATLRRKIYRDIYSFLTEFDNISDEKIEADFVLKDFIENKLSYYAQFKNDPSKNILSGLSKYHNLGFISSQRIALEVIKSEVANENKESFLEELIVRKELSDNFCLYCKNFKSFDCISNWAKISLNNHSSDLREYIYSIEELENAKTHDKLWNATQMQLIKEGVIHGYLRMYWAKKILKWTILPQQALQIAIYLNDKYAYDAPSASGYTGILWAMGALHDRAFASYPVMGKIRTMTYNSMKKKYNLEQYFEKYLFE